MFHLFQNQLLGLSAGNAENTPNNNAMLNHFQTNIGIGPCSLLSQIQSNQCAMQSINAPIGQVASLQAQHVAGQNNPTTLQYNPSPLLELTATQRGILASQQAETSSSLFQHVHSNSAPTGQVQFNLPLSSRTTVGQDQLDPLSLSLLNQTTAPQGDNNIRQNCSSQVDLDKSDDNSVNDSSELEECFLPHDVQEKVGLIDRCIKSE